VPSPLCTFVLNQAPLRYRLFYSHISNVAPEPPEQTSSDVESDISLFPVKYNDEDGSNDLVGCLANQVFPKLPKRGPLNADPGTTGERAITDAADVIAFAPVRDESLPSYQDTVTGRPQQRRKFSFPNSFYLDRFLMTNHERAQKMIQNANVAEEEIRRLRKKKTEFTKLEVSGIRLTWPWVNLLVLQNKDVMKSLRSSLYYYENVAQSPLDAERQATIESCAAKLKNIIAHIENELEGELQRASWVSGPSE
jgi:hypothetical protein